MAVLGAWWRKRTATTCSLVRLIAFMTHCRDRRTAKANWFCHNYSAFATSIAPYIHTAWSAAIVAWWNRWVLIGSGIRQPSRPCNIALASVLQQDSMVKVCACVWAPLAWDPYTRQQPATDLTTSTQPAWGSGNIGSLDLTLGTLSYILYICSYIYI